MIHPLLRLLVSQPQLLSEHAEAYGELLKAEVRETVTAIGVRAVAGAVALVMALIFLVLVGVAAMLWAITPAGQIHAPWVLLVVPAVPLVLAVVGALLATRKSASPFVQLRQQVAADLSMFRQAGAA